MAKQNITVKQIAGTVNAKDQAAIKAACQGIVPVTANDKTARSIYIRGGEGTNALLGYFSKPKGTDLDTVIRERLTQAGWKVQTLQVNRPGRDNEKLALRQIKPVEMEQKPAKKPAKKTPAAPQETPSTVTENTTPVTETPTPATTA